MYVIPGQRWPTVARVMANASADRLFQAGRAARPTAHNQHIWRNNNVLENPENHRSRPGGRNQLLCLRRPEVSSFQPLEAQAFSGLLSPAHEPGSVRNGRDAFALRPIYPATGYIPSDYLAAAGVVARARRDLVSGVATAFDAGFDAWFRPRPIFFANADRRAA
jgi:hypothetical protein